MSFTPIFPSFTPKELLATPCTFEVPLYQRLFSWQREEIDQLLNDLLQAYKLDQKKDYHIGIITVVKKKDSEHTFLLVDGQQRMTVLMLLGCVNNWCDFLYVGKNSEKLRVTYFARDSDSKDMKELAKIREPSENVKNINMRNFFSYWNDFIKSYTEDESAFKEYIFTHMRVLISELPKNYVDKLELQNLYFEKLNSAGRQLEPHEILKTKLGITGDNLKVWNGAMDFSKSFKNADSDGAKSFSVESILKLVAPPIDENGKALFEPYEKDNEKTDSLMRYAPVDFSMFLLHVLDLYLTLSVSGKSVSCWETKKLLDTYLGYTEMIINDQNRFIELLKKYRIYMDENIIHILLKDGCHEFRFWDTAKDEKHNNEPPGDTALRQFQSMLYVSSGEKQKWIVEAYRGYINSMDSEVPSSFIDLLKNQDNQRHTSVTALKYRSIDRYWFWRLDYYLWERLTEFFDDMKSRDIAKHYVFRGNRSIEHVAPQNPKTASNVVVSDKMRDSFGNLSMISNSQNSKLQNESFEVKRAHVEAFINSSTSGSVESLKMLKVYVDYKAGWNDDMIRFHGDAMIRVLIDSFPKDDQYKGVRQALFDQISEDGKRKLPMTEGISEFSDLQRSLPQ